MVDGQDLYEVFIDRLSEHIEELRGDDFFLDQIFDAADVVGTGRAYDQVQKWLNDIAQEILDRQE